MKCDINYNLVTEFPIIAKTWNYEKNIGLSPFDYAPKSNKKVWWKCDFNPNHEWEARISNRTIKHEGCPQCFKQLKVSFPAKVIYFYLKKIFPNCELEYKVKRYHIDIFIPEISLAIEHDGLYHHKTQKSLEREKIKDNTLEQEGYKVLHIKEYKDLSKSIEVKDNIIYYCSKWQYKENIDEVVKSLLLYISNITNQIYDINVNVERDYFQLEHLFFHEKKKRTLSYNYPKLISEWDPNNKISPDLVCSKNQTKYLWICPKCHNSYKATIPNRVNQNSGCPYCSNLKVNSSNCLAYQYPELIKEWDYEKNKDLTPFDVVPGAEKRIWWKCSKCGNSWNTWLYQRTGKRKSNCPYCAHIRVYKEISLGYLFPELIEWWDYDKNYPITPNDVTAKSNKIFYWKCPVCNYIFSKSPNEFTHLKEKNRCSRCRDNSKKNLKIERIKHLWSEKNGIVLTPELLTSDKDFIFECHHHHFWNEKIENVYRNKNKCPYCSQVSKKGKLPLYLIEEWNYEKKKNQYPEFFTSGSGKKVWWKCKNNHEWEEQIRKRAIRNFGCPYCSGHRASKENCFATKCKELLQFWDYDKNIILPTEVTANSGKNINWKCPNCNHSFKRTIINMTKSSKCPKCKKIKRFPPLDVQYPNIISEWNYEKNKKKPSQYSAHSNQKVWWKCLVCNHEWETFIYSRTAKQTGCPNCYKNRRTKKTRT